MTTSLPITAVMSGIFAVVGVLGLFLGIGISIYGRFKPEGRWQETAHDVCGRAMLILVAALILYGFSQTK